MPSSSRCSTASRSAVLNSSLCISFWLSHSAASSSVMFSVGSAGTPFSNLPSRSISAKVSIAMRGVRLLDQMPDAFFGRAANRAFASALASCSLKWMAVFFERHSFPPIPMTSSGSLFTETLEKMSPISDVASGSLTTQTESVPFAAFFSISFLTFTTDAGGSSFISLNSGPTTSATSSTVMDSPAGNFAVRPAK